MDAEEAEDCDYDFKPIHFLRCHSRLKDDKGDIKTRVWCCAFEPDALSPEKTTSLVATCGANSVCLTNVKSGEVVNKYYSDEVNEDFFTIAWTTLYMKGDNKDGRSNVFAVAGRSATIHLIHPEAKLCFCRKSFKRQWKKGAGASIASMLFHPLSVSVLIVCFSDGEILLLDIGQPCPPDYVTSFQELQSITVPEKELFGVSFSRHCEMLLAASDDGVFGWPMGLSVVNNNINNVSKRWKFSFPIRAEFGEKQLIDSVEPLKNGALIASKCACYGEIYIWDVDKARHSRKDAVVVTPDYIFKYSDTDNYFMAMGAHPTSRNLVCGDDKGRLWIYNILNLTETERCLNPSSILPWPLVTDRGANSRKKLDQDTYDIIVNKVAVNCTGEYIVAVTSTNLVCIWKKCD